MFVRDLHRDAPHILLRYPHAVRLGQAPMPSAADLGVLIAPLLQGNTLDHLQPSGPIGDPSTTYAVYISSWDLQNGVPEVVLWATFGAGQMAPYIAQWQAAHGGVPAPTAGTGLTTTGGGGLVLTTPPPTGYTSPFTPLPAAGQDVAQIISVIAPAATVPAGAQITLQVTVLNAGGATWGPGYTIVVQAPPGTPTAAPQAFATLPGTVAPGQSATVTVTLWAPTQPGSYTYAVGMYNPASQAISALLTAGLVVTAPTTGSSVIPTTAAGYVSAQEFGTYVQAMLARQAELQGAVAAMEAGAAQRYSPTYTGAPGPPTVTPADQQAGAAPVVIQAASTGLLGLSGWAWLLLLAAAGGGAYYLYGRSAARHRAAGGVSPRPMRRRIARRPLR